MPLADEFEKAEADITKVTQKVEDLKQAVYDFICKKECTYPSEIATELFLNYRTVKSLVSSLLNEGSIVKLKLDPNKVPLSLKKRLVEFWRLGIRGYDGFKNIMWIIPKELENQQYNYKDFLDLKVDEGVDMTKTPEEIKESLVLMDKIKANNKKRSY